MLERVQPDDHTALHTTLAICLVPAELLTGGHFCRTKLVDINLYEVVFIFLIYTSVPDQICVTPSTVEMMGACREKGGGLNVKPLWAPASC